MPMQEANIQLTYLWSRMRDWCIINFTKIRVETVMTINSFNLVLLLVKQFFSSIPFFFGNIFHLPHKTPRQSLWSCLSEHSVVSGHAHTGLSACPWTPSRSRSLTCPALSRTQHCHLDLHQWDYPRLPHRGFSHGSDSPVESHCQWIVSCTIHSWNKQASVIFLFVNLFLKTAGAGCTKHC